MTTGISPALNPRTSSRPSGRQDAQAVGHPVAPNRVDHDVDRPFSQQVAHRGEPAAAEHGVVRAAPQRELPLRLVTDDRDCAQPERSPQLDGGGPDAARRAVHEQGFARLGPRPPDQRKQASQVVQGSGRTRLETHVVRQRQNPLRPGR